MRDYVYVTPRLCVEVLDEPIMREDGTYTSTLTFGPNDAAEVAAEKISEHKARYTCPLCNEDVEVYID